MLKLMVVDDEVDICDFVKNFFKERDFEVFVAYDGRDAIKKAEMTQPHIILLDVLMPGMDGIETLRNLRSYGSEAKVVMVTAVEDYDKVENAKKLGAIEYITKPLLLDQLERTVLNIAESLKHRNP